MPSILNWYVLVIFFLSFFIAPNVCHSLAKQYWFSYRFRCVKYCKIHSSLWHPRRDASLLITQIIKYKFSFVGHLPLGLDFSFLDEKCDLYVYKIMKRVLFLMSKYLRDLRQKYLSRWKNSFSGGGKMYMTLISLKAKLLIRLHCSTTQFVLH